LTVGEIVFKKYEAEEAAAYADLMGVCQDLAFVVAATDRLLALLNEPRSEAQMIAVRAHWMAALIAYARCFGSGKRQGLSVEVLAELEGDPIGAHEYFLRTRNKHVAHSVNAFEETVVGFNVGSGPTHAVEGIAHLHIFRVCDDADGVRTLGRLARIAQAAAERLAKPVRERLLAIGQQLSSNELMALPGLGIHVNVDPARTRD
jgi:hypothetical protein